MSADAARAEPRARVGGLVVQPFRAYRFDERVIGSLGAALAPSDDHRFPGRYSANALVRPASHVEAAATLSAWIGSGALRQDPAAGLYACEQRLPDGGRIRGLLGALALRQPDEAIVIPHEDTETGPVADRLALMTAAGLDLEPILAVYDGGPVAAGALDLALAGTGLADAVTPDGARHRLARIPDELAAPIAAELLPRQALIADGHHRYAAYLRRQELAAQRGDSPGPWDFGLTLLVDGDQQSLDVRPIHRVLPALRLDEAVARMRAVARVTPLAAAPATWPRQLAAAAGTAFVFAASERAYLVDGLDDVAVADAVASRGGTALRQLAVTVLAGYVMPAVFGRQDSEAVDVPDAGTAASLATDLGGTAILLPPISFHDVLRVAAAGDRMPRKSTLFLPKPAAGLAFRVLGDQPGQRVSDVTSTS